MDIKQYRTKFYREKYQNDPVYRDKIKLYNRKRYKRLTINCLLCKKRWNIKQLENIHFQYDNINFQCPNCLPENKVIQIKLKRRKPNLK